jgi:dolichol-phosphate mannosyltransferase
MDTPIVQTQPSWPRLLVIPAYNEEQNLPRLLADLECRPGLLTPASRVYVVDDGSQDGTADVVAGYGGPLPVQLVRMGVNRGPGAAFARGFNEALAAHPGEAFVITLEADNTSDLDVLDPMLVRAAEGAGLVLASVHGGGRMLNVTRSRRLLSAGAGVAVRHALALDARTVSSFFRVYRASVLRAAIARHGDRLIQERGFRLQGRTPGQDERARRDHRRGAGRPRRGPPRGREQDAGAADDGRIRTPVCA